MSINQAIDARKEEMVSQLCRLIAMPSLEEAPQPGKPFGAPLYDCLESALALARSLGFSVCKNVDGYAGYVEMGQGEEEIGILAHLDVVPPGDGWSLPPFKAHYATAESMGMAARITKAASSPLYTPCARCCPLAHSFKRRVRPILGCSEETRMTCIDHYLQCYPMPDYGFSPDGSYPLINTEKGIQDVHGTCAVPLSAEGLRIVSLQAGDRPNVIPGKATAVLFAPEPADLQAAFSAYQAAHPESERMQLNFQDHLATLTCLGIVGHASTPEQGRNAAGLLLSVLAALPLVQAPMENAVRALSRLVGDTYDGAPLGIACQDEISGALTCNLGLLHADENGLRFTLDIRYPLYDPQPCFAITKAFAGTDFVIAGGHGIRRIMWMKVPRWCRPFRVYAEQTGLPAYCMAIGGGTYARKLPGRAVAFGMEFPGQPATAHMADEYMDVKELVLNAKIIAHAIYALATEN
ncbi:MAG: Sapep family Mn(2+)-dependent dipeptidase [Christensenellales bacterium]